MFHLKLLTILFGFYIIHIILISDFNDLSFTLPSASAQAFCALRQPNRAQQKLFPNSTRLQAFTNTVTHQHKISIQNKLSFSIHANELGLHTLYAVFSEDKHTGFIHVRSEKGEWGLIEIAWALTPDLKIKDFIFQRCRESARFDIESDTFKLKIQHKNITQLKTMLNATGTDLNQSLNMNQESQHLALRVIKSALKTLAVTSEVWSDMLTQSQP
jgi:hypothetical protein